MKHPSGPGLPRTIAADVLNKLESGNHVLDAVMDQALQAAPGLSRQDRALVMALVFGVLRHRGRIDWTIAAFSKTRLDKMHPPILNILRLGVFQLLFLTRVPPGLAVHSSVEMAKKAGPAWVVKFVNGLLRTVDRQGRSLALPDPAKDPAAALCVAESYPPWLVKRWLKRFGFEEAQAMCRAGNVIAPITVRVNTLKTDSASLEKELQDLAQDMERTPWLPDSLSFHRPVRPVFEMPPFIRGEFAVQDAASQLVCRLAAPMPGQRVLDACAGLGAKTGCLAQLMENQGEILAADLEPSKIAALEKEMVRLGVGVVKTTQGDFSKPVDKIQGKFNLVLVDAPCSGLGVIRRNPDAKWSKTEKDITRHAGLQAAILENASVLVDRGGILVYSVCTTEPEETEQVAGRFLESHAEFALEGREAVSAFLPLTAEMISPQGFVRTYPHKHGADGFFAVRMRRIPC